MITRIGVIIIPDLALFLKASEGDSKKHFYYLCNCFIAKIIFAK